MNIKVNATLRSPDLTADIGDVVNVDDKMANLLIKAGAAELVEEEPVVEVVIIPVVEEVAEPIAEPVPEKVIEEDKSKKKK